MTSAAKWSPDDVGPVQSVAIKIPPGEHLGIGARILGRTVAWIERGTETVGLRGVDDDDIIEARVDVDGPIGGDRIARLEIVG